MKDINRQICSMEEIKFRAWHIVGKEMIYFDFTDLIPDEKNNKIILPYGYFLTDNNVLNPKLIIMQYAGIRDKNLKDIYKGDLVLSFKERVKSDYIPKSWPQDRINVICEIVFEGGEFTTKYIRNSDEHKNYDPDEYRYLSYLPDVMFKGPIYWNEKTGKHDLEGDNLTCPNLKVIGNIHQNPEISKKG